MSHPDAFLRAYDQYANAIFRHCLFRVFQKERAEELMQETFTRTWQAIVEGQQIRNLRAFLYRVANNLIIDDVRRKKPCMTVDELIEQGVEPCDDHRDQLFAHIDGRQLLERLQELDPDDRNVLILRYVDGLGPKEIAQALDETPNVISVRIHRATKRLHALYVQP